MRFAVLAASNFTDPEHERLIWLAAGGLVLLGVLLAIGTVVWWRGTKGEHAALAPLELMGDRSFAAMTPVQQGRRLDAVRLQLDGDVEPSPAVGADAIDLDDALRAFQPGFDDLRDDSATRSDGPEESPEEASEEASEEAESEAAESADVVDTDGPTGRTGAGEAGDRVPAESTAEADAEDAAPTEVAEPQTPAAAPERQPFTTGRNGSAPRVDPLLAGEPAER